MQGYSLQDMIDIIGCLNEAVLCKIAIQIIQSLQEYNSKLKEDYGEFCTCEILFDKNGNLKLMPNFLGQLHKTDILDQNNYDFGSTQKCKCHEYSHKNHPLAKSINLHTQLFDLGYVVFLSAIGGMKFDSLEYLLENLWNKTNSIKLKCCLLHTLISLENSKFKSSKLKITQYISSNTFSDSFIDFLCQSMRFNITRDNKDDNSVFNHSWVNISNYIKLNNNYNKIRVSIKELIKLLREHKKAHLITLNKDKKSLNFLNNFDIILSNNKLINRDELIESVNTKKDVIKELSAELGISPDQLIKKLQSNILRINQ